MLPDTTLMKGSDEKLDHASDEVVHPPSQDLKESLVGSVEEKRLVRKLDVRTTYESFPSPACFISVPVPLDRSNIGNARLQGLPEDVLGGDKSGKLFDWLTSAFFFSYIVCQIPATVASKLFPPKTWMACGAIGFGTTSTLMATGFNFPSILVTRIFLGVFIAGFAPQMTLYFSFFYTREELGLRLAVWCASATIAGAFGGLVAFGIQHIHASVQNWRLLFIVEGIPPVILGVVTYLYLPNRPESTTYLTEWERKIAVDRMNRGASGDVGAVVNRAHILAAFRDWRVYVGGMLFFPLNCSFASIGAFLPTIITTMGFTDALAQLLTFPPYIVAAIVMLAFAVTSDRLQSRGILMAVSSAVGGVGYLLLIIVPDNVRVRYFSAFCITSGTFTSIGLTLSWFGHNLGSETKKAAGIPIFMAIGQCGSVLGSHLYPQTEGPRYIKGFGVSCALMFVAALCCVTLSISYCLENRKRDRLYGKPQRNVRVNTHELADKAPDYRYMP